MMPLPPKLQPVAREIETAAAAAQQVVPVELMAVVVYGSWARGEGRPDSDVDVAAVCACEVTSALQRLLTDRIWRQLPSDAKDTFVNAVNLQDFEQETAPFHTAEKRDGIVVWGGVDMRESTRPFHVRYRNFFLRSWEAESSNVRMARLSLDSSERDGLAGEILGDAWGRFLVLKPCAIAAKHCVQINLQMLGLGFTSKWQQLEQLCRAEYGNRIADAFCRLSARLLNEGSAVEDKDSLADVQDAETVLGLYRDTARRFCLPIPEAGRDHS